MSEPTGGAAPPDAAGGSHGRARLRAWAPFLLGAGVSMALLWWVMGATLAEPVDVDSMAVLLHASLRSQGWAQGCGPIYFERRLFCWLNLGLFGVVGHAPLVWRLGTLASAGLAGGLMATLLQRLSGRAWVAALAVLLWLGNSNLSIVVWPAAAHYLLAASCGMGAVLAALTGQQRSGRARHGWNAASVALLVLAGALNPGGLAFALLYAAVDVFRVTKPGAWRARLPLVAGGPARWPWLTVVAALSCLLWLLGPWAHLSEVMDQAGQREDIGHALRELVGSVFGDAKGGGGAWLAWLLPVGGLLSAVAWHRGLPAFLGGMALVVALARSNLPGGGHLLIPATLAILGLALGLGQLLGLLGGRGGSQAKWVPVVGWALALAAGGVGFASGSYRPRPHSGTAEMVELARDQWDQVAAPMAATPALYVICGSAEEAAPLQQLGWCLDDEHHDADLMVSMFWAWARLGAGLESLPAIGLPAEQMGAYLARYPAAVVVRSGDEDGFVLEVPDGGGRREVRIGW